MAAADVANLSLSDFPATTKHYHKDSYQFTGDDEVVGFEPASEDKPKAAVILKGTIFHPTGGGQPADSGKITGDNGSVFIVEDTKVDRETGVIRHFGSYEGEQQLSIGDKAQLVVDEDKRRTHARLHSAGHLIDIAVTNVGLTSLEPTKGAHQPGLSYVEYNGEIPAEEREGYRARIEEECAKLIAAGSPVSVVEVPHARVGELCGGWVPDYLSKDSDTRVVTLVGDVGCPCGGTHVKDVADIKGIKINKVGKKKKAVRVSYELIEA